MDTFHNLLSFSVELDRMKSIYRQTKIIGEDRFEDDAQHTFHVSAMAVLLASYAEQPVQLERVLTMLLFHDVVELEAGDTFCYDADANKDKKERERVAANRIFGRLPSPMAETLRNAWQEFEENETAEARFANALDRAQPVFNNYYGGGGSWVRHGVTKSQVLHRIDPIRLGSQRLYEAVLSCVNDAVMKGWIREEAEHDR